MIKNIIQKYVYYLDKKSEAKLSGSKSDRKEWYMLHFFNVLIVTFAIITVTAIVAIFSVTSIMGAITPRVVATIAVIIVVISVIVYFLIEQLTRFTRFYSICNSRIGAKHSPKIMLRSMFKYLIVIFSIGVLSSYNFIIIGIAFPAYFIVLKNVYRYIKIWRYHDYSMAILIGMTIVTIVFSFWLSPFIWVGINEGVKFFAFI